MWLLVGLTEILKIPAQLEPLSLISELHKLDIFLLEFPQREEHHYKEMCENDLEKEMLISSWQISLWDFPYFKFMGFDMSHIEVYKLFYSLNFKLNLPQQGQHHQLVLPTPNQHCNQHVLMKWWWSVKFIIESVLH